MDLFSMGVFDDERTPREKTPKVPVRCLEDELLPPAPKVPLCSVCGNHARQGHAVCLICERESRRRPNLTPERQEERRFIRLRAKMICNGGVLVEDKSTARTLASFVDAGNARWANRRDLHRLGLRDDGPRVAILVGWAR
jgi:hypothetical protein